MARRPGVAPGEPVAPPERPSGLLSLLSRRYFRRMWTVTSVSSLGDWLGVFALTVYVKDLSGRPEFAVGGVLLFRVVPGLLFGPFAGVMADRFDRRRLMVTADLMRAGLVACIPWIDQLWTLYLVSAALEVLGLLWAPAKDATLPNLVERHQLMTANQLMLITTYGTFPAAGALVALLAIPAALLGRFEAFGMLAAEPISLAFFVDAATFLYSALAVATFPRELMRTRRVRGQAVSWNPLHDMAEGIRFIRQHPVVRTLVGGAWVAFTGGGAVVALGPIFADRLVGTDPARDQAAWGALIVAVGVGLVLGMITAGPIARHVRRERIFPFGLMLSGAGVVVTATLRSIEPALLTAVIAGFGTGIAWVMIFTLLQERVDDRLRGRTFAALYTGIKLSLFIGLAGWPLLAGLLGDHVLRTGGYVIDLAGSRVVLFLGGTFVFLAGIVTARGMRAGWKRARLRGLRFRPALAGGARRGLFISFEGVEGSGKSTQLKLLRAWLRERGRDVVVTREPGGTPIAERIRNVLLDPGSAEMDPKTEALLYAAARAQHVAEVIRPALDRDAVVLCDRYLDSSLAYQGLARGLGEDDVLSLNTWATDELLPDLVVLLHLDPEVGLARVEGSPDRIEQEDVAFHRKVGEAYLHLARSYPSRFAVVDASGGIDQVQQQIRAAVLPFVSEP